jgi:hypothetical protein
MPGVGGEVSEGSLGKLVDGEEAEGRGRARPEVLHAAQRLLDEAQRDL